MTEDKSIVVEEDFIENNRLIAEFMDIELFEANKEYFIYPRIYPFVIDDKNKKSKMRRVHQSELKYHSSWDWLHSPIMKAHDECKLYSEGLKFFEGLTIFSTIQQVWQALVDFINWYNSQSINQNKTQQ